MDDRHAGSTHGHLDVEPGRVIDVPLTGADTDTDSGGGDGAPTPPNWRRAIAIALVAGTVVGIGVTVLRLTTDDEDAPTDTAIPTDELAVAITTPPTLAPLGTLPPANLGGGPITAPPTEPAVTRPSYREIPGVGLAELVQYDIAGAIGQLDDDVARRSDTHVEFGTAGLVLDVSIERDPVNDRYRITLESRGDTQVAIVDVPSGTTYINPETDDQVQVLTTEITAGSTAADVNDYFDRLLLGPLRSDTYNAPSTRGRGLVTIDGIGQAREFVTVVPGDIIPEWQLYVFGPVFEFPVQDRPSALEYAAYVTDDGRLAQVDGVALIGQIPQLVQHRVTLLDGPPLIELPRPATPEQTTPAPTTPVTAP